MRSVRLHRGAILAIALMTALVASIFAYTLLALSVNESRQARFFRNRASNRYLAEAGMVIAQTRIRANPPPGYCGTNEYIDTNNDATFGPPDPQVQITVTPCAAGGPWTIQVRAIDPS